MDGASGHSVSKTTEQPVKSTPKQGQVSIPSRGKHGTAGAETKVEGSLLAWRTRDRITNEPHARSLALTNPHNLCYANVVIHMLHYARSHDAFISGLGEVNGAIVQASRSNQHLYCQTPGMELHMARMAEAHATA